MPIIGIIIIIISFLIFILTLFYVNLREHVKLILPITLGFGFLGYGLMIYDRVTELTLPGGISIKTLVQKTLERAEFVEKMEKIVLAQSETIGLVAKQANEMQPEILRVADEVKKFERFINEMKDNLQKEYQIVSEDIEPLKLQYNLPILSHKAISQEDREAFEAIIGIAITAPENTPLKKSATQERISVTNSMYTSYLVSIDPLVGRQGYGLSKFFTEIPTDQIMVNLSDSDPKVRAKAAGLLGSRPEKGVPDRLLQVARTDKSLRVASYAMLSFGRITGLIKMRDAEVGQDERNLIQFSDMYNIDKLEQWWKEHSAEVNGRLTEMK